MSLCFHLSHGQTHFSPTHAATDSGYHPNGHQAGGARVEGSVEQQCGSGATGSSSQPGAGWGGSTEEPRVHMHPRDHLSIYQSCLDSTLQHVVHQLDILTQVSCANSQKI